MENIISDKIFDFVKAFGENVVLFTQEGESTLDSDEAKRFYLKDSKIMVNHMVIPKQVIKISKTVRL